MKIQQFGEFRLIERMLSKFQSNQPGLTLPAGDDCAVLNTGNSRSVLVTTDLLVEDIHFRQSTTSAFLLGRKSIAVNLSDIAAMGGVPTYCFLSIACPKNTCIDFIDELCDGMADICREFNVSLAGGDTTSSPDKLVINICLMGDAEDNKWVTRSGAEPGDVIQVSGYLGQSTAGLNLIESANTEDRFASLCDAQLNPFPRVATGLALNQAGVNAMIDISDGLMQDLGHICEKSGVGAVIDFDTIPISRAALQFCDDDLVRAVKMALAGGEDYELCWTVSPDNAENALLAAIDSGAVNSRSIGIITTGKGITIQQNNSRLNLQLSGWDHFTEEKLP